MFSSSSANSVGESAQTCSVHCNGTWTNERGFVEYVFNTDVVMWQEKDCNRHRANPSASGNVKGIQFAAVQGLFRVLGIVWGFIRLGFKVGFVKGLGMITKARIAS